MKRTFFIILYMLADFIGIIAISILALYLFVVWYPYGGLLDGILLLCLILLSDMLQTKVMKALKLNSRYFPIYSRLPSILLSPTACVLVFYFDSIEYWDGVWFGGLGETVASLAWITCTAVLTVGNIVKILKIKK